MVFSSIPAYLDPSNWQQQNHQIGSSSNTQANTQFPPPPPPPPQPHGSSGAGSIRPGSMADRARMANIPMPEAALKCPRCESTNTKFCYFNNYSLAQPRHFCKTCRRYWTRGGALRNVPVGGGCRRNKRTKSTNNNNNNKSPSNSTDRPTGSGSTSTTMSTNSGASDILGLGHHHMPPPLRFMTSTTPLLASSHDFPDIGLNYGSISNPVVGPGDLNFHSTGSILSSLGGFDQWRLQQQAQPFSFLGGLDSSSAPYPFEGDHSGYTGSGQVRPKFSSPGVSQMASVKMEQHNQHQQQQDMNLSRQFLGIQDENQHQQQQYWINNNNNTANAWTDLSSFSSSSTSNPL